MTRRAFDPGVTFEPIRHTVGARAASQTNRSKLKRKWKDERLSHRRFYSGKGHR